MESQSKNISIKGIDHVGILVHNIEEHIPYYRDILQLPFLGIKTHESQKIKTAIFQVGDPNQSHNSFLEVFEPLDETSPVYNYLMKKGEGIHHLCFGVTDIQQALDHVAEEGIKLIHKEPFIGVKGTKVAFLHPKSTGKVLTEFAEIE